MTSIEFDPGEGSENRERILFLHGFPGVRSKQNRDIAEMVAEKLGRRVVVALYEGLGSTDGEFSFARCLRDVEGFFLEMSSHAPIDLVGHSWGGYQALRLAGLYPERVRRIVLMSPLLKFFSEDICVRSFAQTAKDNPHLHLGDTVLRAREFREIGDSARIDELIDRVPASIALTVLQADDDQITPSAVSSAAFARRSGTIYEMRRTDHSFLMDRPGTADRISKALGST